MADFALTGMTLQDPKAVEPADNQKVSVYVDTLISGPTIEEHLHTLDMDLLQLG